MTGCDCVVHRQDYSWSSPRDVLGVQFAVGLWLFQALVQEPRAVLCAVCCVLCCAVCCVAGCWAGEGDRDGQRWKGSASSIPYPVPSHDACQHQCSSAPQSCPHSSSGLQQPTYPTLHHRILPTTTSQASTHHRHTHRPPSCTAAVDTPPHLARWLAGWLLACFTSSASAAALDQAPHHAITPTTQHHPPRHHSRSSRLRRCHFVSLRRTLTAPIFTNTRATTALRATHIASHFRPAEPWHGPADGRQTARRGQADIARR